MEKVFMVSGFRVGGGKVSIWVLFFDVVCLLRVRWCAFLRCFWGAVVFQLCVVACCGCACWSRFHSYFGAPGAPFCTVCGLLMFLVCFVDCDILLCWCCFQVNIVYAKCWRAAG